MAASEALPFITEAAYARSSAAAREILWEAQTLSGPRPVLFPQPAADFYDDAPLRYEFPPITLATLHDVVVRGRSNLLTTREAIVRHGLVDLETDLTPEEFYGRLSVFETGQAAWAPADPFNVDYLPEAAAFTDATSFNYAHWLTEVLPRIAAFAMRAPKTPVPLIVDAELHANLVRSVRLLAGPDAPLYPLAPDRLVRVGRLYNVSPTGHVAFKLRPNAPRRTGHGVFGPHPLRETVARLRRAAGVINAGRGRQRLLVRRNADLRRIVNQADIDMALEARGFRVIDPGALTLEQQIAAYSAAAVVVGGAGAAIANLIFTRPDCPTVVLIPKQPQAAFWYWRRMAAAAGSGPVLHVVGELTEPHVDPFDAQAAHKDFRVAAGDVLDAVAAAEAQAG